MAISAPMAATLSRIEAIRTRFEPPQPTVVANAASNDFASSMLSALGSSDATNSGAMDALMLGSSGDTSSIDLSMLSGSSLSTQPWSATSTTPTVNGNDVVEDAKRYLGVPYKWGGTDPSKGLDCSGLVQRVYGDLGIDLPRVSQDQAKVGTPVASIADAVPGDLVAFGSPVNHIAIYAGGGKILQAPHTGDVVKISDIKRPITAIRRVIDGSVPITSARPAPSSTAAAALYEPSSTGVLLNASEAQGQARYQALFDAAGAKYGVPPALLASVARAESGFNPNATSGAGAVGLMQFMPATAAGLGIDPTDPAQAVDGAARYLSTQLRNFGSVDLALAAYNAGPGAVRNYGGVPPFTETRNYVNKVTAGIAPAAAAAGRTS